jgi:hypothetical protein
MAALSAASVARAVDAPRCQELARQFQGAKPQITAIEVSLALFSAADGNCIALATELLDFGASVDARDRLAARPLSHAARFGHVEKRSSAPPRLTGKSPCQARTAKILLFIRIRICSRDDSSHPTKGRIASRHETRRGMRWTRQCRRAWQSQGGPSGP